MGKWQELQQSARRWGRRLQLRPEDRPAAGGEDSPIEMLSFRAHADSRGGLLGRTGVRGLRPTREQRTILILLGAMMVLISVLYQFALGRWLLYPFVLLSVIFHEFGHALMVWLTGGRVGKIVIEWTESGYTSFAGGWPCLILPAGYIGSSLAGGVLLFMAFGHRPARYTAMVVLGILLVTLYYSHGLFTVLMALLLAAIILGAIIYQEGLYTRHFVLFLGAICALQGILSILYTTIFHTIKDSDAYQFAQRCSVLLPAVFYGLLWLIISLLIILVSILAGLFVFQRRS